MWIYRCVYVCDGERDASIVDDVEFFFVATKAQHHQLHQQKQDTQFMSAKK